MTAPAFAWYQNELKHRDFMTDAALVFAYYEKCDAGPIPTDVRKRAEEKLNMAGPSAAAGARKDVSALVKKLGTKTFCEQYRREVMTGENPVVTGTGPRSSNECVVSDAIGIYDRPGGQLVGEEGELDARVEVFIVRVDGRWVYVSPRGSAKFRSGWIPRDALAC